jgi:ribosome biogenesis protein Nip4
VDYGIYLNAELKPNLIRMNAIRLLFLAAMIQSNGYFQYPAVCEFVYLNRPDIPGNIIREKTMDSESVNDANCVFDL